MTTPPTPQDQARAIVAEWFASDPGKDLNQERLETAIAAALTEKGREQSARTALLEGDLAQSRMIVGEQDKQITDLRRELEAAADAYDKCSQDLLRRAEQAEARVGSAQAQICGLREAINEVREYWEAQGRLTAPGSIERMVVKKLHFVLFTTEHQCPHGARVGELEADPRLKVPLDGPGSHRADLAELRYLQTRGGIKLERSAQATSVPDGGADLTGSLRTADAAPSLKLVRAAEAIRDFIGDIMEVGDCEYFSPNTEPGRTLFLALQDALEKQALQAATTGRTNEPK